MALKYADLFCGIGGFHLAADQISRSRNLPMNCVFASDIDKSCQFTYQSNFGIAVHGDITKINADEIPDHDILFAGFPCQPFSIIGGMRGFEDTRGTLFFDVARIIEAKQPHAFILENVKMLVGHKNGQTLGRIMETLRDLGYSATFRVLNALEFGVPQKRERVLIVGFKNPTDFLWPQGGVPMPALTKVLEVKVDPKYFASEHIQTSRKTRHTKGEEPTIWHENKSGNVSKYPYSCALRAGASYNYLLVDGERRLTEREMLRLQGFPESFQIVCNYSDTRRQAGNSVAVPLVSAVLDRVIDSLGIQGKEYDLERVGQYEMVMEKHR